VGVDYTLAQVFAGAVDEHLVESVIFPFFDEGSGPHRCAGVHELRQQPFGALLYAGGRSKRLRGVAVGELSGLRVIRMGLKTDTQRLRRGADVGL
jgi:hypothetical protein